jgi:GxxExxY protein
MLRAKSSSAPQSLIHAEVSESIIGAAIDVLNALKPGLDEKLFERALVLELKKRGHRFDAQRHFPVFYDDQQIGTLVPDLIVDETVIVDTKVATAFSETHIAQNFGLPEHLRLETRPLAKLQKCAIGLEARRCLKQPLFPITIRAHPCNPWLNWRSGSPVDPTLRPT